MIIRSFDVLLERINGIFSEQNASKGHRILSIDGRAASGKTTLAGELSKRMSLPVIHVDDFFLRPEQRTEERLSEIGGNFDRERFLSEVFEPLLAGERTVNYRPWDCHALAFKDGLSVDVSKGVIIEGAYSQHPVFRSSLAAAVFLTVSPEEQMRRITERNGEEAAQRFRDLWIPKEEAYFRKFGIEESADLVYSNEN